MAGSQKGESNYNAYVRPMFELADIKCDVRKTSELGTCDTILWEHFGWFGLVAQCRGFLYHCRLVIFVDVCCCFFCCFLCVCMWGGGGL